MPADGRDRQHSLEDLDGCRIAGVHFDGPDALVVEDRIDTEQALHGKALGEAVADTNKRLRMFWRENAGADRSDILKLARSAPCRTEKLLGDANENRAASRPEEGCSKRTTGNELLKVKRIAAPATARM